MFDIDDEKVSIVDRAIRYNAGKEEILLFEELSLALELMNRNNFEIVHQYLEKNRIYFEISTKQPEALPVDVGMMFFNIDKRFDVDVAEYKYDLYPDKRFYNIVIDKC